MKKTQMTFGIDDFEYIFNELKLVSRGRVDAANALVNASQSPRAPVTQQAHAL